LTVFVWNRPLASPPHFADISILKLFRACQRLNVLECKSNFRYRHANWILATVWCTFRRPIFQKRSAELSLQSCALFVDNFPKSTPRTAETETLLPRPHKRRFTPNNAGFRAQGPKALLPVNSLVPDLSPGFVNCLPWNWVDAKHQKVRTLKWFAATGRNLSTCS
jgi:hypothetical protein